VAIIISLFEIKEWDSMQLQVTCMAIYRWHGPQGIGEQDEAVKGATGTGRYDINTGAEHHLPGMDMRTVEKKKLLEWNSVS